MKSWVISLRRWSDGAHHSSPTPQISLYLSSTLIQQNNSPKSLSIFHTLPPPPPPLNFILLCGVESWAIRFMSQLACMQSKQTGEWSREQIMYITGLFTCFHLHHFPSQNQTAHSQSWWALTSPKKHWDRQRDEKKWSGGLVTDRQTESSVRGNSFHNTQSLEFLTASIQRKTSAVCRAKPSSTCEQTQVRSSTDGF